MNGGEVSADTPDWTREAKRLREWNPGKSLLATIRCYPKMARQRLIFKFCYLQRTSFTSPVLDGVVWRRDSINDLDWGTTAPSNPSTIGASASPTLKLNSTQGAY